VAVGLRVGRSVGVGVGVAVGRGVWVGVGAALGAGEGDTAGVGAAVAGGDEAAGPIEQPTTNALAARIASARQTCPRIVDG
jgi:hypothetical protein